MLCDVYVVLMMAGQRGKIDFCFVLFVLFHTHSGEVNSRCSRVCTFYCFSSSYLRRVDRHTARLVPFFLLLFEGNEALLSSSFHRMSNATGIQSSS